MASTVGRVGLAEGLAHIIKTEGVRGMFRGVSLNLFKNPMATAVSFAVNDFVKEVRSSNPRPNCFSCPHADFIPVVTTAHNCSTLGTSAADLRGRI